MCLPPSGASATRVRRRVRDSTADDARVDPTSRWKTVRGRASSEGSTTAVSPATSSPGSAADLALEQARFRLVSFMRLA